MASGAKKFKFVSPGIFTNEIDQSQLPADPTAIGPVIIGRTEKGPAMRPVKVSSFEEFVSIYGLPSPGGGSGDDWRNGTFDGPQHAGFAAQAWLKSGEAPVTMVRLLGAQHQDAYTAGFAGWTTGAEPSVERAATGGAYGLWLLDSGSKTTSNTGTLAAVWYCRAGASLGLSGTIRASSETTGASSVLIESNGSKKQFKMDVYEDSTITETICFNFDREDERYIRKVFNTSPSVTNSDVTPSTSNAFKKYWLGETFDQMVTRQVSNDGTSGNVFGLLGAITSGSVDWDDRAANFQNAETGFFFGQDLGEPATYQSEAMPKLFKFISLEHGEWLQRNVKISIEQLRASNNVEANPYGTFSVVLRHAKDNDNAPRIIERFDSLSLNPNSVNYIARRIGDKYNKWSDTERRLREYGDYDNQSSYIRVEMDPTVEAGGVDATLLPFGFYGPVRPIGFSLFSGSVIPGRIGALSGTDPKRDANPLPYRDGVDTFALFGTGTIANSAAPEDVGIIRVTADKETAAIGEETVFTGSYLFPAIRLRHSASDGGINNPTDAYFGINTNRDAASLRFDESYVDMVRPLPLEFSSFAKASTLGSLNTEHSFIFTLDDVVSGTAGYYYESGSRQGSTSYTAGATVTYKNLLDNGYDRFTAPIHGGFDGLNITEKEPFRNTPITDAAAPKHLNSYTFNSIKRAIDTVADPEFVEANLLVAPGVYDTTLTDHMLSVAEDRSDMLAIIDIPNAYTPTTEGTTDAVARRPNVASAISNGSTGVRDRGLNTSYGCTFFPWVTVRDSNSGRLVNVPPSVAALGTFGSSQRSSELWFAPAGFVRGGLSNGAAGLPVTGVKMRLTSKDRDDLYEANINPIATFPNEGIVIFGQKTLQVSRSALDRINVRRLLIFVKKEISRIAAGVLFDPNVQATWDRFTGAVNPFLANVKSRFGLTDFKVVLDQTTTTDDLIDRNILYAKIYLKPARAIEFIALDFVITRTGASFDD
jgi:hypothetical protein